MTTNRSRESSGLPGFPILAAAVLSTACTAPNPDFRPLGLVVSDVTTKQSADLTFDVKIDAQDVPVTVDYEAVDGTAVKGREYLETKGTLTLEPGTTTAAIVVPTLLYNHVPGDVNLKLNVTVTRRSVSDTQTGTGTIRPIAELARFTSIASGRGHSCGVTPRRTVQCWGNISTTRFAEAPADVVGLTNVTAIAAGSSHSCAITAGTVRCWGDNSAGQLGNGTTTASLDPVAVANLTGVTAVAAGEAHTCAVTEGGRVVCWGSNAEGQLGNSSSGGSLAPGEFLNLSGVTAVAAGASHTCVVVAQGAVKCWGRNSEGQLGNNSTANSPVPVDVKGPGLASLTGITAITAGVEHTCALATGRRVQCWGGNRDGQLGNNSTERSLVATFEVSFLSEVTSVAAGSHHTCAVVAQGAVKCWGSNGFGQLGNDSNSTSLAPVEVAGGLTGITTIAAGAYQTLALTAQGTIKGWGSGSLGGNVATSSAVPVDVPGFTKVTAVVVDGGSGPNRTCAVTAQKTVQCTTYAELLRGVDLAALTDVTAIAVGFGYTCAITGEGTVKCVGNNSSGQLGNNSTTDSEVPVEVIGLSGVTSLSAAGTNTCARTAEGRVKCWGLNYSGLVDAGLTDVTSIGAGVLFGRYAVTAQGNVRRLSDGALVPELADVTSIAVGFGHACALTSQGTVKCWGSNRDGQLGNNSTTDSAVPVKVAGLSGVTSISAGYSHTCAVTSQGTAMCWGSSQYGSGISSTTTIPSEALGGHKVLGIVAGFLSTLFITPQRTVRQVGFFTFDSRVPIDTVYVLK